MGTDKKPCQGKSVQTKPCNMQPCEPLKQNDDSTVMLPMIVKTMRVSSRP